MTGDQRAKLDVKYDHTKAQVNPLYDYALHPGDHVIVQEVTKTAFDDMLESIADPLRRATGSRSVQRPKAVPTTPPIAAQGNRPGRIGDSYVLSQPGGLFLAMANPGPHAPLLATDLTPTFSRFLRSHKQTPADPILVF